MCLYHLRRRDSYSTTAKVFGVSRTTCKNNFIKFCNILGSEEIRHEYINFPNVDEVEEIANDFFGYCGLPGVIGAVDGTDVPFRIAGTLDWLNYKKINCITSIVMSDLNMKIRYILSGIPGRGQTNECKEQIMKKLQALKDRVI